MQMSHSRNNEKSIIRLYRELLLTRNFYSRNDKISPSRITILKTMYQTFRVKSPRVKMQKVAQSSRCSTRTNFTRGAIKKSNRKF